jgi:hypothetical protein
MRLRRGVLFHIGGTDGLRLAVPASMIRRIMAANHEAAIGSHFAQERTHQASQRTTMRRASW